MNANEIISKLAEGRTVEKVLAELRVAVRESAFDLDDLTQDIYLSLLEKPEGLVQSLYEKGEFEYYIMRMAVNNICSKTSPYYQNYKRFLSISRELEDGDELKV